MPEEIYPCLWFDNQAQTAAKYYCSIFENATIASENPMVVIFLLNGKKFMALNGGPQFQFNESVSFVVTCDTQQEIDHYWYKLTADGGTEGNCGWLKDKFGVSWQIVPRILSKLMSDREKAPAVIALFRTLKKFNIQELENL